MLDGGQPASLRVEVTDLLRALAFASSVIERRNTIPILGMARLVFDGETLTITGTDLDIEITTNCEAVGVGEFRTCVDPNKLRAFCHGAKGAVEIRDEGNDEVSFVVEGCTLRLRSLPPEDFPEFLPAEDAVELSVGPSDLLAAVRATAPCISTEETRYYLNGAYLTKHPETELLRFVTTDGHRMAIYDLDEKGPEAGGIIPRKVFSLLGSAIGKGANEPIRIGWAELRAVFHTPAGVIRTKLIDGKYPDYTRVLPAPSDNLRATVNAAALQRAISVSSERSRALTFDPAAKAIVCRSPDIGSATVPCQVEGERSWGFNGNYALDLCRAAGGPIQIKGERHDAPFRVVSDDPRALWVLMPMRT